MINEVTISGTVKNIRTYTGSRGTLLTGWFDQRDVSRTSDGVADREVYITGLNLVTFDKQAIEDLEGIDKARQGAERSAVVTIKGRLVTRFDRRQGIAEKDRKSPTVQLEVLEVVTQ